MKIGPIQYAPRGADVVFLRYDNDQTAIRIVGEHNEPLATASVNITAYGAPKPVGAEVWLKTWEENEGLAEALEAAGVLKRTGARFQIGYVCAELAEFTTAAMEEIARARNNERDRWGARYVAEANPQRGTFTEAVFLRHENDQTAIRIGGDGEPVATVLKRTEGDPA